MKDSKSVSLVCLLKSHHNNVNRHEKAVGKREETERVRFSVTVSSVRLFVYRRLNGSINLLLFSS